MNNEGRTLEDLGCGVGKWLTVVDEEDEEEKHATVSFAICNLCVFELSIFPYLVPLCSFQHLSSSSSRLTRRVELISLTPSIPSRLRFLSTAPPPNLLPPPPQTHQPLPLPHPTPSPTLSLKFRCDLNPFLLLQPRPNPRSRPPLPRNDRSTRSRRLTGRWRRRPRWKERSRELSRLRIVGRTRSTWTLSRFGFSRFLRWI